MPIYALTAAAAVVYVAWLGLIVHGQVRKRSDRRVAAERFERWMNQTRPPYDREADR